MVENSVETSVNEDGGQGGGFKTPPHTIGSFTTLVHTTGGSHTEISSGNLESETESGPHRYRTLDELYSETVARVETIRLLLEMVAQEGWVVHHLDIKSAFLNGDLLDEVYVIQPEGFKKKGEENKVYRLVKALYGLRQAPRAWNAKLHYTIYGKGVHLIGHVIYRTLELGGRFVLLGPSPIPYIQFCRKIKACFMEGLLGEGASPLILNWKLWMGLSCQQRNLMSLGLSFVAFQSLGLSDFFDCRPEDMDVTRESSLLASLELLNRFGCRLKHLRAEQGNNLSYSAISGFSSDIDDEVEPVLFLLASADKVANEQFDRKKVAKHVY
ncbi:uncharacterized protein LOC141666182 [Apium graveolens]|uniref:uncharacterized protein LOC141666182 n=1 Tax=Apium graveolens TaxID=4045 RepID=UPI003D7ACFA0